MAARQVLARTWRRVVDAPHMPIAIYLAYIGVGTLIAGPSSTGEIEHALPLWLTYAWSAALAAGGLAVISGVLAHRDRLESSGHALHLFGLAVAAMVFIDRGTLDDSGIVAVVTLGGVSAIRMWQLARIREAYRAAAAILNGGGE